MRKYTVIFFFKSYPALRVLHSFPTRRSSDLEPIKVVDIDGTFATMYPLVGTDMLEHVSLQLLTDQGMALYVDEERSEEHTSELQSHVNLVCRLLLEKIIGLATHHPEHVNAQE